MEAHHTPWLALPSKAPYVLDGDRNVVDAYNQTTHDATRIETALLPEPYVGGVDAPIVLLLLNPGVSDEDFALHGRADFRQRVFACLRQETVAYPNYYLDPAVTGPGARWVTRVTRPLADEFGAEVVANDVLQIEYFPYHSRRFAHHRLRVPSQDFTFDLVRAAIEREAAIFIARGRRIWEQAVPELVGYDRAFRTRSVQNVVISAKNCPEGYEAAQKALLTASEYRE
jgi:hypothetical protein